METGDTSSSIEAANLGTRATDLATAAIEHFLTQMEERGCTAKSLANFERKLLALIGFNDWKRVSEFTLAGAHQFIAHMAMQGLAPKTIDSACVCIRALGRYLFHEGLLPSNVFDPISLTNSAPSKVARPITLDELRDLIQLSWRAGATDGRARFPRPVLYATLALTGLRLEESLQLTWRDVMLDCRFPFVRTRIDWARSRREHATAINDELAALLRYIRTAFGRSDPEDRVFAVQSRVTFREDLAAASRTSEEDGTVGLTPRSLRLFFLKALNDSGVRPFAYMRLARDAESSERYEMISTDADPEEDLRAVNALPKLWPAPVDSAETALPWLFRQG